MYLDMLIQNHYYLLSTAR